MLVSGAVVDSGVSNSALLEPHNPEVQSATVVLSAPDPVTRPENALWDTCRQRHQ